MKHQLEPLSSLEPQCDVQGIRLDDTKETLQTNKQRALTSLQVLFS